MGACSNVAGMEDTNSSVQPISAQSTAEQSTGDRVRPGNGDSPESTSDHRVDEQLAVLDQLSDRPIAEHVPILEGVHRALSDVLSSIDTAGQS